MMKNVGKIKKIIQRIRNKEGGIGSDEDELALHRLVQDLNSLTDTINTLTEQYGEMLETRDNRIKELETQLNIPPQ